MSAAGTTEAFHYHQRAGVIPPGEEDAEQYEWPRPGACADGLPGTVPLLYLTGHGEAAAVHTDGTYRFCAREDGSVSQVVTWWLAHVPSDHVAYWDFDDPAIPDAPRDTSATAIAAAALLKLGRRDEAAATADALTHASVPPTA